MNVTVTAMYAGDRAVWAQTRAALQLVNQASQAAHRAWGFSETERVVYFRKTLGR